MAKATLEKKSFVYFLYIRSLDLDMKNPLMILHYCNSILQKGNTFQSLFFNTLCLLVALFFSNTLLSQQTMLFQKPVKKYFVLREGITQEEYMPKTVIIKLKTTKKPHENASLQDYLLRIGSHIISRKFPFAEAPSEPKNRLGQKYADLSRIYEFSYTANYPIEDVINKLYSMNLVDYAEPHYLPRTYYNPNDPEINKQGYLSTIMAYQAWDVIRGSANVVIGIVDTGTDIDHPDLTPNIKYNTNDQVNGVDDDGDGYIDNFQGWDLFANDNNPDAESSSGEHGVHVSGCASAATDNGKGVAGTAFKAKLLTVRVGSGSVVVKGYEGIVYAADHGADIINCSWGGSDIGQSEQDAITYATINKEKLVVAAAGNSGSEKNDYPGAYKYVFAVAATSAGDTRSNTSTYGKWVDVAAPGENIYSTQWNNAYGYKSGTSMASPITAGCIAMVKAQFPFLSNFQAGEQLRVTTDNIDALNPNDIGKMGSGRVNLYQAVSNLFYTPSIQMDSYEATDFNDRAFVIDDTVRITAEFINYLAGSGNVTITLSTTSPYVTLLDETSVLGTLATLETKNNALDPFLVKINSNAPQNESIIFKLVLTDGAYMKEEQITFTVNVDYVNIAINDVATTVTSTSLIGFNDFKTQVEGLGFIYPYSNGGENVLYDAGLMVGISGNVSDKMRGVTGTSDKDMKSIINVHQTIPSVQSAFDVAGIFNDAGNASPLGVEVKQKAYAWSNAGHRKYIIIEYTITNTGNNFLPYLYAGIYADWDIDMGKADGYTKNRAKTDFLRQLGYVFNTQSGGYYCGVQSLKQGVEFFHYALDNNGANQSINPNNNFLSTQKYTALSTLRAEAGTTGNGNDVSHVVSAGPFWLHPQDSAVIAFALIAGDDLSDIQASADSAWMRYNKTPVSVNERTNKEVAISIYPNPTSGTATLILNLKEETSIEISIYNTIGENVTFVYSGIAAAKKHTFYTSLDKIKSGVYFYYIKTDIGQYVERFVVIK